MPTKSSIAYITEDKPNPKSGYAIINTEVKRGKANDRRTATI